MINSLYVPKLAVLIFKVKFSVTIKLGEIGFYGKVSPICIHYK